MDLDFIVEKTKKIFLSLKYTSYDLNNLHLNIKKFKITKFPGSRFPILYEYNKGSIVRTVENHDSGAKFVIPYI